MFGFFNKKSFFDGWDNFLSLFLTNILFAAVTIAFLLIAKANTDIQIGNFALMCALFLLIICLLIQGTAGVAYGWVNGDSSYIDNFKKVIKKTQHLFFFFSMAVVVFFCIVFLIPFYMASHSFMGIMIAVVMFWGFALIIPAMQYYFPLSVYFEDDTSFLTFKKCLALTLNNKAFTFALTLKTIIEIGITICTCFLVPGFAGIAISHANAVKLLMLRSDYMREHAIQSRKDLNYYRLFEEENAKIGKRSIRSMIFPWRDSK